MSEFAGDYLNSDNGIDFSKAKRLAGGGSTCDIYKAVWQRRKVFVKRLKPEYRNKPLYISAFDKEFDIGVNLNHKSLPQYLEFHDEYIVMDFIDGKTLAEMIEEKDHWLSEKKNVVRILKELLAAVDYLHQHNVVHCDIKTDNIMITAGNRNLMLIDLDKCYTDWLSDSSGAPSKFQVENDKIGDKAIDFHGIGLIVKKLTDEFPTLKDKKFSRLINESFNDDASIERLQDILNHNSTNNKLWMTSLPLIGLVIAGIIIWRPDQSISNSETFIPESSIDSVIENKSPETEAPLKESSLLSEKENPVISPNAKPDYKTIIEKEMASRLAPLNEMIIKKEQLLADSLTTDNDLLDILYELANLQSEIMQDSYKYYESKFSDIDVTEIQLTVALSKPQKEVSKKLEDISARIAAIIESRHQ